VAISSTPVLAALAMVMALLRMAFRNLCRHSYAWRHVANLNDVFSWPCTSPLVRPLPALAWSDATASSPL